MDYYQFLEKKSHLSDDYGFDSISIPDFLFDFQKKLIKWAIKKGRCAIFADCGLGKTPMQLVFADNIIRYTNKKVIIIAPLAVSYQTIKEGEKFGIECSKSNNGLPSGNITITNYEQLHKFDPNDYVCTICDESSILKNFDGKRKKIITEFVKKHPYRLMCTATAAPNDYIELGTTSEALGELGYMDMLNRFFKNEQNTSALNRFHSQTQKWRFKKHAQIPFWKWVSSWAKVLRKPSDLGFEDGQFILSELIEKQTIIENQKLLPGELFHREAIGLKEQRIELRMTLKERCEKVAEKLNDNSIAVAWCHLNDEGNLLERIIEGAVQVSGSDSDDRKEQKLKDFTDGNIRILITKPKIAGFGLNWQHCAHMTFFPSHSFEQYYQSIRRCWRFGQKKQVIIDIITTKGGLSVLKNLKEKSEKADKMFNKLIEYMDESLKINNIQEFNTKMEIPSWL